MNTREYPTLHIYISKSKVKQQRFYCCSTFQSAFIYFHIKYSMKLTLDKNDREEDKQNN